MTTFDFDPDERAILRSLATTAIGDATLTRTTARDRLRGLGLIESYRLPRGTYYAVSGTGSPFRWRLTHKGRDVAREAGLI